MHTLEQLQSGELAGVRRLDLAAGLTEFPSVVFTLADSLEVLNLTGNQLSTLPDDLPRLHQLRILFCSENRFTEVPAVLGRCPQLSMVGFKANQIHHLPREALSPSLRWLILTDNELSELPEELGRCSQMQKLMLTGNRLTHLPPRLAECRQLELLRIAANHFETLPSWLFSMPRLCWLAAAGNPASTMAEEKALARHPIEEIAWSELTLHEKLGEGASGIIHRASWRCGEQALPQEVAVKIFKGAMTSDGLPTSEMDTCISAGQHPNLIPLLGKVVRHPAGAEGLVMELIDPHFRNLAGPPSLDSCTRDIYPPETSFPLPIVIRLAHGVAAAVSRLHQEGIMHGDLYAHNILHTAEGKALLGDFGAACFHDLAETIALPLQQLEVRAFGVLLEELLARSIVAENGSAAFRRLQSLRRSCLSENPAERPLFEHIRQTLADMESKDADKLGI